MPEVTEAEAYIHKSDGIHELDTDSLLDMFMLAVFCRELQKRKEYIPPHPTYEFIPYRQDD